MIRLDGLLPFVTYQRQKNDKKRSRSQKLRHNVSLNVSIAAFFRYGGTWQNSDFIKAQHIITDQKTFERRILV